MNKAELIDLVAERADISKKDATNAVEAALDGIKNAVAKGDKVSLGDFGSEVPRWRRVQEARRRPLNPVSSSRRSHLLGVGPAAALCQDSVLWAGCGTWVASQWATE